MKWGVIQPLTGGVVVGGIDALNTPPSWIISYPGLTEVKHNKQGDITTVGNEYGILKWLKDHNQLPPYQVFNKKPFQNTDLNVELIDDPVWSTSPVDYSDTDIVISVPVCSGLSGATIAPQDTKDERNCNMIWNAEFALAKVSPKVYIFENAPALFTGKGSQVRSQLNDLGSKYGYSVVYYKTDTCLHDNCQKRPRTFVIFIKHRNGEIGTPVFRFENKPVDAETFFSRIPSNASQQVTVKMPPINALFMEYIHNKFGNDYRSHVQQWILDSVINNNLFDDVCKYAANSNADKKTIDSLVHLMQHIKHKLELGKGYYCLLPSFSRADKPLPVVMFKTIPSLLHYKEERLYTIRELLHEMGMPHDYELQGNIEANYAKIGQNVPVRTAQWIISEAARIVSSWDSIERNNPDIMFVDNTKQTAVARES